MTIISIVEDEPFIVEALRYLFELEGWDVHILSDGADAADQILAQQPSLIVLDYMLPNKSGITVAREVRGHEPGETIPILMLTAKGQAKDRQLAHLSGVTHFMTKPFANAELVAAVKEMLQNADRPSSSPE